MGREDALRRQLAGHWFHPDRSRAHQSTAKARKDDIRCVACAAGHLSSRARIRDGGTSFGLWAPRATRVELALVDEDRNQTNHDMGRHADGVWTVFIQGIGAEQRYGFRVHGRWDPAAGTRFNPAKLLVDPYARAITGGVDYSGPILDHTEESNYVPDTTDSFAAIAAQCRGTRLAAAASD